MYQVGVLIYIRSNLTLAQRSNLEKDLTGVDGICVACFIAGRQHLLTVEYNPNKVNARQVLSYFENHGITASNYNH